MPIASYIINNITQKMRDFNEKAAFIVFFLICTFISIKIFNAVLCGFFTDCVLKIILTILIWFD